jgi:diguanylate cyclase (GGDEF)-like protein
MTPFNEDRLRRFIAPVIPPVMLGVAGMTFLAAAGYWAGLTPGTAGVPWVLVASGVLATILTLTTRAAALRGQVDQAGYSGVAFVFVVCSGVCLAAHVNNMGILYGLPYCVLTAVGASFFWLRRRHFVAGQVAAFLPPFWLLVSGPHPRLEWAFAVQLSLVAMMASTAIYLLTTRTNHRTFALATEVQRRATYDGLTGVLNRSTWIERAERQLLEDQHRGYHTACLFLDMDRFKQINDDFGHEAGDEMLGSVAAVLNRFATEERLVGRVGGDEFVILLPRSNGPQAAVIADRILTALGDVEMPYRTGDTLANTVASIGIATSTETDSLDQLLRRADMAMLATKERHHRHERASPTLPPHARGIQADGPATAPAGP